MASFDGAFLLAVFFDLVISPPQDLFIASLFSAHSLKAVVLTTLPRGSLLTMRGPPWRSPSDVC